MVARAMTVCTKGVEHRDEEDHDTPHWAHYDVLADGRVEVYVDCQRMIGARRSKVLRRILREELQRSGVKSANVAPNADDRGRTVRCVPVLAGVG